MNRTSRQARRTESPNPFIGVVSSFVKQIESGGISPKTEMLLIAEAEKFARSTGFSFTPTLSGVVQLAEKAERLHRNHMDALSAQRGDGSVRLTGFDRSTGQEL